MNPLWKHQQLAVDKARRLQSMAIFFEIGTGKTSTMINILREEYTKQQKLVNTLIFAPLSVCPQWKKEFSKWSKIPEKDIFVLTGSGKQRSVKLAERIHGNFPSVVVTNYESVRIKDFYQLLLKWNPKIVILDESHRVKDSSSMQSQKIFPLCYAAERKFILTGTPILNSMLDIFGQYRMIDTNIFGPNFWKFKSLYFYDKNAGRPNCNFPDWQPRPTTAKEISAKIAASSVQAKKAECLDLPPLLKVTIPVELSVEQEKAYQQMKKTYVAEVKDTVITAEFAMIQTMRMQQILAGFIAPDPKTPETWCSDVPRLDALKELLENINGKKVIIWTNFKPTYKKIAEVAEKAGYRCAFLTGEQSAAAKQQSIESFCRGDINCLVSNPSAGGAGINLQEAQYSIYYSRGYSLEHFLQSEGRNYRGGSEMHSKITHYHLVAEGTLDETIADALLAKKSVGDTILEWAKNILANGK